MRQAVHGCSPGRPLPESLDRVARVMAGETSDAPRPPLAETCTFCGKRPPQFVFFAVSGTLGNVIQLGLDRLFVTFVFDDSLWWAPTLSWTASYSLSIAFRHFSHAFLVFGPPAGHWAVALAKTYATYFTTIVASTATNLFFVTSLRMRHELALVLTAAFSVIWSYWALRYSWRSKGIFGGFPCCREAEDGRRSARWRFSWYRSVDRESTAETELEEESLNTPDRPTPVRGSAPGTCASSTSCASTPGAGRSLLHGRVDVGSCDL